MGGQSQTVELPVILRVSERARQALADRAAASGTDVAGYVSAIVEQSTQNPASLEEISGPIRQRFLESGLSDHELADALEREKHEARAQRRARRAS